MSEYLSDQEQADRVIKLIKTHGLNVLTMIMLALSAYFGWQYWQNKKISDNSAAAIELSKVTQSKQKIQLLQMQGQPVPQGETTQLLADIDAVIKKYPKTLFSQQALMQKAQYFVTQNDLAKAKTALQQAKTEFTEDKGVLSVLDLRLAKVLIANKETKEALSVLGQVTDESFQFSKLELEGDAYLASGNAEKAKAAYQQAWDNNDNIDEKRILAVKLESLGVIPEQNKTKSNVS